MPRPLGTWLILVLLFGSSSSVTAAETTLSEVPPLLESWVVSEDADSANGPVPVLFRQQAARFRVDAELVRDEAPVRVYKIRFPSPIRSEAPNNTVHGMYYQPIAPGKRPGVVVLHPIGGGTFELPKLTGMTLARSGTAALFIKLPYYGERRVGPRRRFVSYEPTELRAGMIQAVRDIRRACSVLESRANVDIDADQLGVTGISLGGIMSALAGAAEPRFSKVAIYLGGGELAQAVWANPHPKAEEGRQWWRDRGGTRESLIKLFAPFDPATYGHLLRDREVLMVAAANDEVVPPAAARSLAKAIGGDVELVWLDAGHITAARFLYGELLRTCAFFRPDAERDGPLAGANASK